MASFTFVFHECSGAFAVLGDPLDLPGLPEAQTHAVGAARAIMAREVAHGKLCLTCWIVIKDTAGQTVSTLQFGDAIEVTTGASCQHLPEPVDPRSIHADLSIR